MSHINLRHPIHGEKIANSLVEAKHDKEHGWEEFDPTLCTPKLPPFLTGGVTSDLPPMFPCREVLVAAGFTTWAEVKNKTDDEFLQVKGIGAATVKQIREFLDS